MSKNKSEDKFYLVFEEHGPVTGDETVIYKAKDELDALSQYAVESGYPLTECGGFLVYQLTNPSKFVPPTTQGCFVKK